VPCFARLSARAGTGDRIAAAFAGLAVGYLLHSGGMLAIAAFIAFAMFMGITTIGVFGPKTKSVTLEEISR